MAWISFDSSNFPAEQVTAKLDEWLAKFKPSAISKYDRVAWISVSSPHRNDIESDVDGFEETWQAFLHTGRPVNLQSVTELAQMHHVLVGKWLFHLTSATIDQAWGIVAKATVAGKLGMSAKVSPKDPGSPTHVVCVYSEDFTNTEQVMALEKSLREAGISCQMHYKPDVYTYADIYHKNRWGMRATIHTSKYDKTTQSYKITSVN